MDLFAWTQWVNFVGIDPFLTVSWDFDFDFSDFDVDWEELTRICNRNIHDSWTFSWRITNKLDWCSLCINEPPSKISRSVLLGLLFGGSRVILDDDGRLGRVVGSSRRKLLFFYFHHRVCWRLHEIITQWIRARTSFMWLIKLTNDLSLKIIVSSRINIVTAYDSCF